MKNVVTKYFQRKRFEVDIDLPGFKKDEKDEKGTYVRHERYAGSMSRSFYVGEQITEDDIHPKYENGILSFSVPKKEGKAIEDKKRYIAIEG